MTQGSPSAPTPTPPGRCRTRRRKPWEILWPRWCKNQPSNAKSTGQESQTSCPVLSNPFRTFPRVGQVVGRPTWPTFRPTIFLEKTEQKLPKSTDFRSFLELLSRFELETSSLPILLILFPLVVPWFVLTSEAIALQRLRMFSYFVLVYHAVRFYDIIFGARMGFVWVSIQTQIWNGLLFDISPTAPISDPSPPPLQGNALAISRNQRYNENNIPISTLRTCIHSRNRRMAEGFFRQARQIFAGIIGFISRKFNAACREKTRPDSELRLWIQVLNQAEQKGSIIITYRKPLSIFELNEKVIQWRT